MPVLLRAARDLRLSGLRDQYPSVESCRPDKASPPSGVITAQFIAGWRLRLSGLRDQYPSVEPCRPDKASPPSGMIAAQFIAGWRLRLSGRRDQCRGVESCRPDKASPPSGMITAQFIAGWRLRLSGLRNRCRRKAGKKRPSRGGQGQLQKHSLKFRVAAGCAARAVWRYRAPVCPLYRS